MQRTWDYNRNMKIQLNGEPYQTDSVLTIAQLITQLSMGDKRFAVEVNEQIIPRGKHSEHQLQESDIVEVVVAIGGG